MSTRKRYRFIILLFLSLVYISSASVVQAQDFAAADPVAATNVWGPSPAPPLPTPTPNDSGNGPNSVSGGSSSLQPATIGWSDSYTIVIHPINPPIAIMALVLVLTGVSFCFFGTRNFRHTLFLAGWYVAAAATFIVLTAVFTKLGTIGGDWVYTSVIILVASLCGLISLAIVKIAVVCIGALFGYILGISLLTVGVGMLVSTSQPGQIAYSLIAVIIGTVLVFFQEYILLLVGTSLTGALSIMIGLDLFIRTGYAEVFAGAMTGAILVQDSSSNNSVHLVFAIMPPTKVPGAAWAIFVSVMVFAAFGAVVQQIPPAKKIPDPPKPRAAFGFWPWQPVIPPQPHIPRHKSWYTGEAGSGWRPRL